MFILVNEWITTEKKRAQHSRSVSSRLLRRTKQFVRKSKQHIKNLTRWCRDVCKTIVVLTAREDLKINRNIFRGRMVATPSSRRKKHSTAKCDDDEMRRKKIVQIQKKNLTDRRHSGAKLPLETSEMSSDYFCTSLGIRRRNQSSMWFDINKFTVCLSC